MTEPNDFAGFAAFRVEWPRVVGAILRAFGDIDLAEESAQEAFTRAAERLAQGERIGNLGAWTTTVARRVAIDSLRHDAVLRTKLPLLISEAASAEAAGSHAAGSSAAGSGAAGSYAAGTEAADRAAAIRGADEADVGGREADDAGRSHSMDDRLGLILVACDPMLSPEQQIVLALRIACGVPTADIARFFALPEPTIAARLTRAKKAIARSGIPFVWPTSAQRISRRAGALSTVYGVYTLGHAAPAGDQLMDAALATLALGLATALVAEFPDDTESLGLLAIIQLGEARRPGRTRPDGMPLTLAEVDRSAWGRRRIRIGLALAERALPGGGRFALQAGIAGLHSSAATWEETDWGAIATLYHGLVRVWPAPMVKLARAIATTHLPKPEQAIAEIESLRAHGDPQLRRRASAALADVHERRGDLAAALEDLDDAERGSRMPRW